MTDQSAAGTPHMTSSTHHSPSPRYSCIVCEIGACDPDVCFYEPKDLLLTSDGTRLCHPCAKKHFRDISHLPKFAPTEHPDATAVGRFAVVMKAKLALKRAEGRGGWEDKQQCTPETLSAMLIACVRKGDPIDVANLAMMLHQRGERIELNDASEFESADFYWRTMDPDDSGEYPQDAINRAGLGPYCVAEIASSFTGPRRFGFTAPVLDPESDEEEFLHFATQTEAVEAAKVRRELIEAREQPECCTTCDVPFEVGDLVYWNNDDSGHLHADCIGPERESYVNADGAPLKDDEPIPAPFAWKPDHVEPAVKQEQSR